MKSGLKRFSTSIVARNAQAVRLRRTQVSLGSDAAFDALRYVLLIRTGRIKILAQTPIDPLSSCLGGRLSPRLRYGSAPR